MQSFMLTFFSREERNKAPVSLEWLKTTSIRWHDERSALEKSQESKTVSENAVSARTAPEKDTERNTACLTTRPERSRPA